jgi:hypothetical protein
MAETASAGELRIAGCKQFDNGVEELLKEIARIKAECKHEWVLTGDLVLKESKVKDIYIVGDVSTGSRRDYVILELRCVLCSQEKSVYAHNICTRCLHKIIKGKLCCRKEYFGEDYPNYSARLGHCVNCGLSVVWDEWVQ